MLTQILEAKKAKDILRPVSSNRADLRKASLNVKRDFRIEGVVAENGLQVKENVIENLKTTQGTEHVFRVMLSTSLTTSVCIITVA